MSTLTLASVYEKAARIKLVLFDVDGVLTDRKIYYSDSGEEYKAFNLHDGLGIKLLRQTGVEVGIITARQSAIIHKRMQELDIRHIYQGYTEKIKALQIIISELNLELNQIAYVGDDLPDLSIIRQVGLGIAVADAVDYVRKQADWCTQAVGGQGAGREVCELIMQAQGTLNTLYENYL
jgi:3-deoxy-D-manno-octulosonate 8-phosphate phosphatase (KDO 8-P phosphatase)